MRPLKLWRALETMPVLSGVGAVWERLAGADLPALKPFLRPRQGLAKSYPCPHPGAEGCPRGVVVHGADDIVAVCRHDPRGCDSVPLTRADLVVYELDLEKLAGHLCAFFRFDGPAPASVRGLHRTFHLGNYHPVAGFDFPAYFTVPVDSESLIEIVERLCARDPRPFLLLASTTEKRDPACAEILRGRKARFLSLAAVTAVDEKGSLVVTESADKILAGFHDDVIPAAPESDGRVFFPTPSGAGWKDVSLRFRDGHTLSIDVLGVKGVFNYTQMGMASRKNAEPTRQWELLQVFAKEHGQLTWRSSDATTKNQKRKEILAKDLRRFFRIGGDPIVPTDDGRGWRATFGLHGED